MSELQQNNGIAIVLETLGNEIERLKAENQKLNKDLELSRNLCMMYSRENIELKEEIKLKEKIRLMEENYE